jgi:FkbM family methyltransferase
VGEWLAAGDWVVDVGANVGHYTRKFSDAVGGAGRVVAFEPVIATFELLAANVAQFGHSNVTLLNLAASDATRLLGINIPNFDNGLKNYYPASLMPSSEGLQVMTCSIDSLALPHRVALLKIDAEGHDDTVRSGAWSTLERDQPIILIESVSPEFGQRLRNLGYQSEHIGESPNMVYRCAEAK